MLNLSTLTRTLSKTSLAVGIIGLPLWLISYIWIPFRLLGGETEAVWSVVIASEIGAMLAVIFGISTGLLARRYAETGGTDSRRAKRGIMLGVGLFICLVLFNLIGIYFFS